MAILRERQELVELVQVRQGHAHVAHDLRLLRFGQRRRHDFGRSAAQPQHDRLDVEASRGAALLDDTLHLLERMRFEQLQQARVLLNATAATVLLLQGGAQFVEEGRQVPATKDIRMVQRCRPALQCFQIMARIEHLLVSAVTARVRRNDVGTPHHVDAVDIDLDRDVLEGGRARHAVAIGVDADGLIFIHSGWLK
jgi:hypothetical protein